MTRRSVRRHRVESTAAHARCSRPSSTQGAHAHALAAAWRPRSQGHTLRMTEHASQPARLHALTFDQPAPLPEPCSGSYVCACLRCQHERWERARQGVRPTTGLPVKARAGLRDAA